MLKGPASEDRSWTASGSTSGNARGWKSGGTGAFPTAGSAPASSSRTGGQVESRLYEDIQALLSPRLGLPIPVVEGLPIGLPGFTVTFAGSQVLDREKATVSLTRRFFRIADARGGERAVEIVHGQLPPPPTTVEVNGKRFTLLTMETRDGRRLFPDYFQIVRA